MKPAQQCCQINKNMFYDDNIKAVLAHPIHLNLFSCKIGSCQSIGFPIFPYRASIGRG